MNNPIETDRSASLEASVVTLPVHDINSALEVFDANRLTFPEGAGVTLPPNLAGFVARMKQRQIFNGTINALLQNMPQSPGISTGSCLSLAAQAERKRRNQAQKAARKATRRARK